MDVIEQYKILHGQGKFSGGSLIRHIKPIYKLIKKHQAKSLLDYGCGKGEQYTVHKAHKRWFNNWGVMPTLYDPAVLEFSQKPIGKFDGVICTDVLEHIPEEDIDKTLDEIFSYADKFVYLCVAVRPARKNLPDGRNCHLTVKDQKWWNEKMEKYGNIDWQLTFSE